MTMRTSCRGEVTLGSAACRLRGSLDPWSPPRQARLRWSFPPRGTSCLPIRVKTAVPLGDGELYELCLANRELRIERTSDGELIIMSPTGGETGRRNASLTRLLGNWSERDGSGIAFDSSTGFVLANGAMRAPDASWVRRERWLALSDDQRSKFPPLCPDFVVELLSPTDPLGEQQAKMAEYIDAGAARLADRPGRTPGLCLPGWLSHHARRSRRGLGGSDPGRVRSAPRTALLRPTVGASARAHTPAHPRGLVNKVARAASPP